MPPKRQSQQVGKSGQTPRPQRRASTALFEKSNQQLSQQSATSTSTSLPEVAPEFATPDNPEPAEVNPASNPSTAPAKMKKDSFLYASAPDTTTKSDLESVCPQAGPSSGPGSGANGLEQTYCQDAISGVSQGVGVQQASVSSGPSQDVGGQAAAMAIPNAKEKAGVRRASTMATPNAKEARRSSAMAAMPIPDAKENAKKVSRGSVSVPSSRPTRTVEDGVPHFPYVIIGGGTAAGYAAHEFVKMGTRGVLIISSEALPPYERPALSKGYLLGKLKSPEEFFTCAAEDDLHPESWYQQNGITLWLSCTATQVDFLQSLVTTDKGTNVTFEKCMLCTGAAPLHLDVTGSDLGNIFYLRNAKDAGKIIDACTQFAKGPVAIVGGGYLAMEAAAALNERGHRVTMVFPSGHVMCRLWNTELAQHYEKFYKAKGIRIMPFTVVDSFLQAENSSDNVVRKLKLSSGEVLEVSFVIVSIGATVPRSLMDDQLEIQGRGVKVNGHLQTSLSHVYAVGDLCSFPVKRLNRCEVMEHVKHARQSAQYAAQHMVDRISTEYDYHPYFYSRFYNLSWEFWGDPQGDVIVGCADEDRQPDAAQQPTLRLCAAWVSPKSGLVNGIMLESATPEETELTKKVVMEKRRVNINLLRNCKSFRTMIKLLHNADCKEESEGNLDKPCQLSKAEVARMLQKLPQKEHAYLASQDFFMICQRVFADAMNQEEFAALGAIHGDTLKDAVCQVLEPHQANVVACAVQRHDQLIWFLDSFGGAPAIDLRVEEEDFPTFVRFCLAWCIWRGFEISEKTSSIVHCVRQMQNQIVDDLERRCHIHTLLSRDEQRQVGKVIQKHSREFADFLLKHIQELYDAKDRDKANEAAELQRQLEESNRREAKLRRTLAASNTAHAKQLMRLKERRGMLAPEESCAFYDPLDYVEEDTRELVYVLVSSNIREILHMDPATSFEDFENRSMQAQLVRLQQEKEVLDDKLLERDMTIEQLGKDLEAARLSALSAGNNTNKLANGQDAPPIKLSEHRLKVLLEQREIQLADARAQLRQFWSLALDDSTKDVAADGEARHALIKLTTLQSEARELRREVADLREKNALLTRQLAQAEENSQKQVQKLVDAQLQLAERTNDRNDGSHFNSNRGNVDKNAQSSQTKAAPTRGVFSEAVNSVLKRLAGGSGARSELMENNRGAPAAFDDDLGAVDPMAISSKKSWMDDEDGDVEKDVFASRQGTWKRSSISTWNRTEANDSTGKAERTRPSYSRFAGTTSALRIPSKDSTQVVPIASEVAVPSTSRQVLGAIRGKGSVQELDLQPVCMAESEATSQKVMPTSPKSVFGKPSSRRGIYSVD